MLLVKKKLLLNVTDKVFKSIFQF